MSQRDIAALQWLNRTWDRLVPTEQVGEEEEARSTRVFTTLMAMSVAVVICLSLSFLSMPILRLAGPQLSLIAAVFPLPFIPISLWCAFMARRGHTRLVIHLYVWGVSAGLIAAALVFDGIRSPAWPIFLWPVAIAGILLPPAYALGLTAGLAGVYMAITGLEFSGVYAPPLTFGADGRLFLIMIMILIMTVFVGGLLTYFNMRSLRATLQQQRETAAALREQMAAEEALHHHLQETVQRYVEHMAKVGRGNLAIRLPVEEDGEQGDPLHLLGRSLNETVANLQRIAVQVRETGANLSSAAAGILAATTQQATGASEQSAAISQTTTTIDEVRAIAEQTAQRAQGVTALAQHTAEITQAGQQAVAGAITSMGEIKRKVETIATGILALSEQAQSISQIITAVSDIAAQSNMLALNAAVEAARAGEAGRGFAIVASEVRALADQSRAATAQVNDILTEIQRGVNTAVMLTEEGMKGADTGVRVVEQTGEALRRLAESVTESAQAALQIASAAGQQVTGMEQIAHAMNAILQVTGQTVASSRQTEQSAAELSKLARSLLAVVEQYRL